MIPPPLRQTRGGIIAPKKSESSGRSRLQRFISMGGSYAPLRYSKLFRAVASLRCALSRNDSLCVFSPIQAGRSSRKEKQRQKFLNRKKSLRVHLSRSPNSSSPYSREGTALPCGFTRFSIFLFFPFFINSCERLSLETLTVRKAWKQFYNTSKTSHTQKDFRLPK